jgi:hypothetical protein
MIAGLPCRAWQAQHRASRSKSPAQWIPYHLISRCMVTAKHHTDRMHFATQTPVFKSKATTESTHIFPCSSLRVLCGAYSLLSAS